MRIKRFFERIEERINEELCWKLTTLSVENLRLRQKNQRLTKELAELTLKLERYVK